MDYEQTTNGVKVNLPDGKNIDLSQIPQIISDRAKLMEDLEKKVNSANIMARNAEEEANELKGFEQKKFGPIKWKSGDTKDNVESTQKVVAAIAKAQKSAAEAQQISLDFQSKLAETSEFLFYLGCYNIASNESMIANLNKQLSGECASGAVLSESVKEQFRNVVQRLIAQKDVLYRQEQTEKKTKEQEAKLNEMNEAFQENLEEGKKKEERLIKVEDSLEQKRYKDAEQDDRISNLLSLLEEKNKLDSEQTRQINALNQQIEEAKSMIDSMSKQLKVLTVVISVLGACITALGAIYIIM